MTKLAHRRRGVQPVVRITDEAYEILRAYVFEHKAEKKELVSNAIVHYFECPLVQRQLSEQE